MTAPEKAEIDWTAVQVGDADPTPPVVVTHDCTAFTRDETGLWFCTRAPHVTGPHVAGDEDLVRAVWS